MPSLYRLRRALWHPLKFFGIRCVNWFLFRTPPTMYAEPVMLHVAGGDYICPHPWLTIAQHREWLRRLISAKTDAARIRCVRAIREEGRRWFSPPSPSDGDVFLTSWFPVFSGGAHRGMIRYLHWRYDG